MQPRLAHLGPAHPIHPTQPQARLKHVSSVTKHTKKLEPSLVPPIPRRDGIRNLSLADQPIHLVNLYTVCHHTFAILQQMSYQHPSAYLNPKYPKCRYKRAAAHPYFPHINPGNDPHCGTCALSSLLQCIKCPKRKQRSYRDNHRGATCLTHICASEMGGYSCSQDVTCWIRPKATISTREAQCLRRSVEYPPASIPVSNIKPQKTGPNTLRRPPR
jgi:hypothetical protein